MAAVGCDVYADVHYSERLDILRRWCFVYEVYFWCGGEFPVHTWGFFSLEAISSSVRDILS